MDYLYTEANELRKIHVDKLIEFSIYCLSFFSEIITICVFWTQFYIKHFTGLWVL